MRKKVKVKTPPQETTQNESIATFVRDDGCVYDCETGSTLFKVLSSDARFRRTNMPERGED